VAVEELVCLWDDRHHPPRYVIPDDHRHVWVGTEFIVEVPGTIVAARLRRSVDGPCMLTLVDVQDGRRLSSARAMPAGSSAGWETLRFERPVAVQAARPYALLYRTTYGQGFAFHPGYFRKPLRSGPVRAIAGHRSDLPLATVGTRDSGSYGVDVMFAPNGFYASKDRPRVIWPQAMSGKLDATRQEVEVGAHFTSSTEGYVDGIAFYRGVGSQGPCYVNLWLVLGESATRLASATVPSAEPSRWVHVRFRTPVRLIAGHQYVAALHTESGFAYSRLRPTVAPPLAFLFGAVLRFDRDAHGFALSTASDGSPTGSACSVPTSGRGIAPLAATNIHPLVTPMFRPTAGARHTLWPEGGVEPMQARQFLAVGIEVGLEFSCEVEGSVEAVRFLNEDDQRYTVSIWDRSGALLGRATGGPDAHEGDGWREIALDPPCRTRPGERYTASYASPSGQCAFTADYFAADPDDPVRTLCLRGHGGVYGPMNRRPTRRQIRRFPGGPLRANYFVDVVFRTAR